MSDSLGQEYGARPGRAWVYENNGCLDFFGQLQYASGPNVEGPLGYYAEGLPTCELPEVPHWASYLTPRFTLPRPNGLVDVVSPSLRLVMRGNKILIGWATLIPLPLFSADFDGAGQLWIVRQGYVKLCWDLLEPSSTHLMWGDIGGGTRPYCPGKLLESDTGGNTEGWYSEHITITSAGHLGYHFPLPDNDQVASAYMKLQRDGLLKLFYWPPLLNGMPDFDSPKAAILTSHGPEGTSI